jgi:hypothetical protein
MAGLLVFIWDIHALGLQTTQLCCSGMPLVSSLISGTDIAGDPAALKTGVNCEKLNTRSVHSCPLIVSALSA